MAGDYKSLGNRILELENLLEKSKEESRYYQKIAEDSGKRRLREIGEHIVIQNALVLSKT